MNRINLRAAGNLLGLAGVSLYSFQVYYRLQVGRRISVSLYTILDAIISFLLSIPQQFQDLMPRGAGRILAQPISFFELPGGVVRLLDLTPLSGFLVALGFFIISWENSKE